VCGIVGIVNRDPSKPVEKYLLQAMCNQLVHRGPDDEGQFVSGSAGIGMRRLSIIDLHGGHQPICNEDRSIWVVLNGEIYNYRELRVELERKGHQFRTASDTEVLVHLYEDEGVEGVRHLRGMFAFAVWDDRNKMLTLVRDRLGIKPLYYAVTSHGLLFGSELKALLVHPDLKRDVSPEAVAHYFSYLCVPGDLSIFSTVHKLPSAHWLTYGEGSVKIQRYWHASLSPDLSLTKDEWLGEIRRGLCDAIESHMVADVPVGAFLSGGLDSGSMVALMAQKSSSPIRTFTVGFAQMSGSFDERDAARKVADRYKTAHYECLLEADVEDLLPKIAAAFDEPFADSSAIPNWLVCQETARHVKVALTGLGGDELFGGYERYVGLRLGEQYQRIPAVVRYLLKKSVNGVSSGNRLSNRVDRLKRFLQAGDLPLRARYNSFISAFGSYKEIVHPDMWASLEGMRNQYDEIVRDVRVEDPLDLALFADLSLYLPDDLLVLSDRISMAHSLEIRVPFLDHHLVELICRLPARYKVKGFQKKVLFKEAIADLLPSEHFLRPKQGFSIPLAQWLRGSLRPMLEEIVDGSEYRENPWLNREVVKSLVAEHLTGRRNHEVRLWSVVCFQEWWRYAMTSPTTVSQ